MSDEEKKSSEFIADKIQEYMHEAVHGTQEAEFFHEEGPSWNHLQYDRNVFIIHLANGQEFKVTVEEV